uniref:Uncharacterized protein n=1 Tax=Strongyloides papillosus TaxID=174720 RepID=A0A0N5CA65_STREA
MKVSKALTLFLIISIFNIVKIYSWSYKVSIRIFPRCYPNYPNEKVFLNLTVGSGLYTYNTGGCNTYRGFGTKMPASVDFQNQGRVGVYYLSHPRSEPIIKKLSEDCKFLKVGADYYICNLTDVNPQTFH